MFQLQGVEVRRGNGMVARDVCMRGDHPGILLVVGAGGAGKSSLLMALARPADADTRVACGYACLGGADLASGKVRTVWLPQHARLDPAAVVAVQMQECHGVSPDVTATWIREAGGNPADIGLPAGRLSPGLSRLLRRLAAMAQPGDLYLLDEPTADLDEAHVERLRQRVRELSARATVVMVTHNRRDCLALGGHTALLAGGRIQECAPTATFFSTPATTAGRHYVQTGYCNLSPPRERSGAGDDGLWWVERGLLCGMSRPGLVNDPDQQCRHLVDAGVRTLVCMEERRVYPLEPLKRSGLAFHHVPVRDMAAPTFDQGVALCRFAEGQLRQNRGLAVHCRGGLGRTGTALAAILAWMGDSADRAIARVRAARAGAIQSPVQLQFVHDFASRIIGWQ